MSTSSPSTRAFIQSSTSSSRVLVAGRRLVDPVVGEVGVDGPVGVAGAELGERVALPALGLAAVVGEVAGAEAASEAAEGAAGIDLGELARVADEHDLGSGRFGVGEEPGELAGADHGGLVDHDHGAASSAVLSCRSMPPRRRSMVDGGDAGVVLELLGGPGGERAADHPVARRLPRVAGGGEGEGLAGAGDALDDLDAVARRADRAHHRLLLVGERRPRPRSRPRQRRGSATPAPVSPAAHGASRRAGPRARASPVWSSGLVGPGRDRPSPSSRRMAAAPRSARTARTWSEPRNPSTRSRTWSTRPPAGSALQTALMTSRSPNVLALAVSPSGLASQRYSRSASGLPGAGGSTATVPVEDGGEGLGVEADGLGPCPPARQQARRRRGSRPWRGGWRRWRPGRPGRCAGRARRGGPRSPGGGSRTPGAPAAGMPATSAMPLRTGPHSTPRRRVSSQRSWAS